MCVFCVCISPGNASGPQLQPVMHICSLSAPRLFKELAPAAGRCRKWRWWCLSTRRTFGFTWRLICAFLCHDTPESEWFWVWQCMPMISGVESSLDHVSFYSLSVAILLWILLLFVNKNRQNHVCIWFRFLYVCFLSSHTLSCLFLTFWWWLIRLGKLKYSDATPSAAPI